MDQNGTTEVTLPKGYENEDVVVKVTDPDGNLVSKDVVIKNSDGSTRDSGKTDSRVITGQGTYIGSVTKTFEIAKANTTLQLEGNMYAASYETLAEVKMPSAVVYGVDSTPLVGGALSWVNVNA